MEKNRAKIRLAIIAVAIIALVTWLLFFGSRKTDYRVGLLYPATGESARLGESVRHAAELAQDRANQTFFQSSSEKLRLDYRDTQGRPSVARDQFLALVDLDQVPLVIGSLLSSDTQGFMKDAQARRIVVIANGSSDPNLRKIIGEPGNYIFRNWPSDDAEGLQMGAYARESLKLDSGYSLVADDPYARSLVGAFDKSFSHKGGTLHTENYPKEMTDFTILIKKASESKPDFFYIVGFPPDLAHLVIEIRAQLGDAIPILSAVGIESVEFFQIAGKYADNIFYTAPYVNPGNPQYLDFQEEFRKRFKEDPDITAAVTYDAVMISGKTIANAGYSPNRIKDYLYHVNNYSGVSGLTTFTPVGDVEKPVSIKRIEHGRPYLLEVFHSDVGAK